MAALRTSCQSKADTRWISRPHLRPGSSIRMFCFPYAGAGAGIFQDWQRSLPAEAELCLIQMPGRGARLSEPCCENVDEVILQLVPELTSLLDRPFVLYGHSMGALLAFMTARYLRNVCGLLPLQLIVSGASAPQIPRALPDIHTLPDAEFLQEIGRFNGTPKEILENAEIMSFMIPILRADFGLCNRYQYTPEAPLACPISVFGGIADRSVGKARLEAWREQTSSDFCLQMFPGDHFFLRSAQNIFLAEVARKLQIALAAELSA